MPLTVKFAYAGSIFEVKPTIEHSTYSSCLGFVQYETDYEYGRIEHNLRLVISWKVLSEQIPNLSIEELKQLGYLLSGESEPVVIIAEIFVKEYPARWRQNMGICWSEWLSRFDEDSKAIGIRADEVAVNALYGNALNEGSVYILDRLDVHPKFRGQRIGMHLCRYVLEIVPKCSSDMIFLLADPIDSKYENGNSNCITDLNRLAEYYAAAGFSFVRIQPDEQILMEAGVSPKVSDVMPLSTIVLSSRFSAAAGI